MRRVLAFALAVTGNCWTDTAIAVPNRSAPDKRNTTVLVTVAIVTAVASEPVPSPVYACRVMPPEATAV